MVEGRVVRVPEGIRSVHSRDGGVVLDVRYGHMFNLNLVGSRIVELLRCGYSDCQIIEEISRHFDVSRETVKSDLQEFLESLEKRRLLIRSTGELP
jgi:Coenzyme PQQ synthesis protein D (PqqD)